MAIGDKEGAPKREELEVIGDFSMKGTGLICTYRVLPNVIQMPTVPTLCVEWGTGGKLLPVQGKGCPSP